MKCKEKEEKLVRQELKSAKREASSKGANLSKVCKRMHATKEEGVASDNMKIKVAKEQKFDGDHFY